MNGFRIKVFRFNSKYSLISTCHNIADNISNIIFILRYKEVRTLYIYTFKTKILCCQKIMYDLTIQ